LLLKLLHFLPTETNLLSVILHHIFPSAQLPKKNKNKLVKYYYYNIVNADV